MRLSSDYAEMYAFVVMIMLNGTPQYFIMERGLSAAECRDLAARPDSGLRIDGRPVSGENRCIPEAELPEPEVPS
ncbi:hypothetical protein [Hyphomicrobium sp.]|uniref:hypothetical protein n=1 Tax=Hyphomicrobium sp. TaxID=82 RepID=UPI0025C7104B|nr:hypothetical protein [Hyphomicrobium sp.]MCC7252929.1 hypothetical protein [Hyphomicrobium sp.]